MKNLNGKVFLVVEDDDDLRQILGELFQDLEAQVVLARSGNEAMLRLGEYQFDCILSDIRMPEGTGIDLARKLLAMPEPKPVLFFCSGFNDLSIGEAKKLNVVKVFSKPFNSDELIGVITDYLEQTEKDKSSKQVS